MRTGRPRATHCKRGHERVPENLNSRRQCKLCAAMTKKAQGKSRHSAAQRWKEKYPDKHRNSVLKSVYGITLEEFSNMLEAQDNKCAICKQSFSEQTKPYVDHVHDETKRTRGLLCQKCNSLLGFACDSIVILESAIQYLK